MKISGKEISKQCKKRKDCIECKYETACNKFLRAIRNVPPCKVAKAMKKRYKNEWS